jgi:hypothetical protein
MEVIKHGKVHNLQNFGKEVDCRCGARLKIVLDDIEAGEQPQMDMRGDSYTDHYLYVLCPECQNRIRMDDSLRKDQLYDEVLAYVKKKVR